MDDVICYCPLCQGQLLFQDLKNRDASHSSAPLIVDKLYCPQCELLVEPVIAPVASIGHSDPAFRSDTPADRGRTSAGGSNAGGSQRGDLSNQGATQWRVDPREAERNTWQPKD